MYFLYILRCKDATLYTGITTDPARRLQEHREGAGSRYARSRGAQKIVYTESHPSRSAALKREVEIKKWRRKKKLELIHAKKK